MGRLPLISGGYRDRLLDAMASLLVDLHRAGVYWGDCSLANTLLRRDGDRLQAHLVDAETQRDPCLGCPTANERPTSTCSSRTWPSAWPTWPRRRVGRTRWTIRLAAASAVRGRYEDLWAELFHVETVAFGDAFAIEARVRRLNELGLRRRGDRA